MKKTQNAKPPGRPHDSTAPLFEIPQELRDFFSRLPAVVYQCGPPPSFATTFVSCNVDSQFGYTPDEFYDDPLFWTKHLHENDRQRILELLTSIGEAGALTYEYRFLRRDGAYVWLHDEVSVLRDERSQVIGLIGSWFDITEYKRLEAMRAGQTQILDFLVKRRSLEESFVQIVRMLESQSDDMVCSILRFDPMTQSLRHGAAPGLPDEYNRLIDGVKIGPVVGSCGTAAYRRERVVVTDIETDPLWADFREASTKWNLRACWSQPILSSSGQLLGTFAMYYHKPRGPNRGELNLIEQAASLAALAIERYRDEEIMRQTERLASLGTFAAGIAHEINNPVGAILLAAEGAIDAQAKGNIKRVLDMLELIRANTERCGRIVRGVLQFGKQSDCQNESASLARILRTACDLTRGYAASYGASVVFSPTDQDHPIIGRVVELEQVFVNVIRNAIESKTHGATVTVQLGFDCDFARVTVADDGQGMNEEQRTRMFDPFFTTRGSKGGTGLGMSIVHGILVSHGGSIRVDSKPKKGTIVVVYLPRADAVADLRVFGGINSKTAVGN